MKQAAVALPLPSLAGQAGASNGGAPDSGRGELMQRLLAFRREFYVVGFFSFISNLLMLTPTIYMLQVYDRVLVSRNEFTLIALSAVAMFLFGMLAFAEWMRSRVLVRAGVRLDMQVNSRIFSSAFEAYLRQAGANSKEILSDLTNVRQFLTGQGIFAFFDAPWVPIYIFVLWVIDPWLGVIAIVFGIVFLGLAYLTHRLTHEPAEQAMESASLANQYAQGKLRNADVIESMGMMKDLRRRWLSRHAQEIHDHSVSQELTYRVYAISKFVRYSQQSLVLGGAALIVIHGDLSPGAMIAANALVIRALQPLDSIIGGWKSFFTARVSFLRLETLLAKFPERAAGLAHRRPTGQLALESLSATAPGRPVPILSDLSADFPAGELIGIVGPSGSGKSTLARCLVGVWPDVAGKVLIDGQTIESWSRSELGPYLGYLPQEVGLLDGTIAENIARFGEVDSAKVIEAAQLAGIHEMILHFPKGYDTPIGESGGQISGGQRQRLGLARAMYGDPAILVLDEPNANLDEAGEVALAKAIVKLKAQGKTVFLITHRKQILVLVDRILLLQDGSIKACGPRRDVLPRLFAHSEKTPMTEVSEDHAAS